MTARRPKGQRQLNGNYFIASYFSSYLPACLMPLSLCHWRLSSLPFLSGHCTYLLLEPEMGISQLCHNSLLSPISQSANKSPRGHRFAFPEAMEPRTSCTQPIPGCVGHAGSLSPWPYNMMVTPTPQPQGCFCSPAPLATTSHRWAYSQWGWGRTRREIVQKFICTVHHSVLSPWVRWGIIPMTPSS